MSTIAVARRYATAMVSLASEQGSLQRVEADLANIKSVFDSSAELRSAVSNPAFRVEERKAVLTAVLARIAVHPSTRNLLHLLNERNRLGAFDGVVECFGQLYDEQTGRVRATVTSAKPLDAASLETLRDHLQKITRANEVVVTTGVDPELIGGIVTRVGDLVLDGSVRTQLALLREQLTHGEAVGDA